MTGNDTTGADSPDAGASGIVVADRLPVRYITIDGPGRANALTVAALDALADAVSSAAGHGARVVVITGTGTRFSAGFDLADLDGTVADLRADEAIGRAADAILAAPVPVVAAVNGAAYGAAVEVLRACDVVVADPAASFAIPATRLGLLYRPEGLRRLHRRLGGAAARFVVVSGERLDAAAAARLGLVDVVADAAPLAETVAALAGRLADAVPAAVAATKQLFAALDGGADDLDGFEPVRRELLGAPSRRAALDAQRQRLTKEERR